MYSPNLAVYCSGCNTAGYGTQISIVTSIAELPYIALHVHVICSEAFVSMLTDLSD